MQQEKQKVVGSIMEKGAGRGGGFETAGCGLGNMRELSTSFTTHHQTVLHLHPHFLPHTL
jgi:hypothetical protein